MYIACQACPLCNLLISSQNCLSICSCSSHFAKTFCCVVAQIAIALHCIYAYKMKKHFIVCDNLNNTWHEVQCHIFHILLSFLHGNVHSKFAYLVLSPSEQFCHIVHHPSFLVACLACLAESGFHT